MAVGTKTYVTRLRLIRIGLGATIVLVVLLTWSVIERVIIEREMAGRRAVIEAEYTALEARYEDLKDKVEYLDDERSVEAELRKRFDVAEVGEQVVIITDSKLTEAEILPLPVAATSTSWWKFW